MSNSTLTPLPTDPLGSALVTLFAIIGIVFILGGGVILLLKGLEKIEDHFNRIRDIEQRIRELNILLKDKSSGENK